MQTLQLSRASGLLLVIAVIAFRYGTAADAYSLKGPKWALTQVPYYVNASNADMASADFDSAVRAAASNWSAQTSADISFYYMGKTSATSAVYDGQNIVIARPTSNGPSAATTYTWFSNGIYVDADIVVWDGAWTFASDAVACSGDRLYLQDVLTHEFGHALGLGHSSVLEATMYPSVTWCSTALRTLAGDDIAGLEKLYPSAARTVAPTAPTGLSASAVSTTTVALAWSDNATSESGYYVERAAGGSAFGLVVQLASNTRTYTDTGLVAGTTYAYRVRAFNSAGSSAYSNTASASTQASTSTSSGFTLSAATRKTKSARYVNLTWRGDAALQLDVYRNGVKVAATANDGAYTDAVGGRGAGTFTYKLCEAGTSSCSNQATATF